MHDHAACWRQPGQRQELTRRFDDTVAPIPPPKHSCKFETGVRNAATSSRPLPRPGECCNKCEAQQWTRKVGTAPTRTRPLCAVSSPPPASASSLKTRVPPSPSLPALSVATPSGRRQRRGCSATTAVPADKGARCIDFAALDSGTISGQVVTVGTANTKAVGHIKYNCKDSNNAAAQVTRTVQVKDPPPSSSSPPTVVVKANIDDRSRTALRWQQPCSRPEAHDQEDCHARTTAPTPALVTSPTLSSSVHKGPGGVLHCFPPSPLLSS